jgi:hypothetical protein
MAPLTKDFFITAKRMEKENFGFRMVPSMRETSKKIKLKEM